MKTSKHCPTIVLVALIVSAFFLVIPPSNLYANSCADKCADAGFTDSSSQGTAPFCNGYCGDIWDDAIGWLKGDNCPVTDIGESSDGSGCWSGSKRCCCRKILDCKSGCNSAFGTIRFQCMKVDDLGGNATGVIGWCDSNFVCACDR